MNRVRRHLPSLSWLALLAMLALALLPTVSRALAAEQGDRWEWAEVCTAQGMQRVMAAGPATAPSAPYQAQAHLDHCSYCGLSAQGLLIPRALAVLQVRPAGADASLRPVLPQPCTPFAWRSAQPRAPPAAA